MAPARRATSPVLADGIDWLLTQSVSPEPVDGPRRPAPTGSAGDAGAGVPAGAAGTRPAKVLDLGGGTGGLAVHLAGAGHDVTVVDPSPDALAALARRAAEAGAGERVRGVQGDAEGLGDLLPADSVDLVLCHGVLEVVDDPEVALRAIRAVLRPGGRLSLLVAQRHAAVLGRVGAGHLRQALRIATDPDGRWGADDPMLRRFDVDSVCDLLERAGFSVVEVEGVRVFADLVPRSAVDSDPATDEVLAALETHASNDEAFLDIAAQLHVHAAPSAEG